MASLKDIRRRIGSVKNTQQITKAMKMVSAAKLRRAQDLINGARPFADKVEELTSRILRDLLKTKTDENQKVLHPLLRQEIVSNKEDETQKPKAYLIAVSSDKGLCGAYNTNVIKQTIKHVNLLKNKYDVKVFCAGRKISDSLRKRGFDVETLPNFWAKPLTQSRVVAAAKSWVDDFAQGKVDLIEFSYTEFKSAISQTARTRVILPLEVKVESVDTLGTAEAAVDKGYVFKPSREELLASLLPKQVILQMYRCFADALASEFGARMSSMDNATRNASDMISDLTLLANRVRQASITTELMEIVGGAEALKG